MNLLGALSLEIPAAYDMIYDRAKDLLGCVFQWDIDAESAAAAKL